MEPQKTSVIAVKDQQNNLVAIVYKDESSRHNVFFRCQEMDFEEIESLLKSAGAAKN